MDSLAPVACIAPAIIPPVYEKRIRRLGILSAEPLMVWLLLAADAGIDETLAPPHDRPPRGSTAPPGGPAATVVNEREGDEKNIIAADGGHAVSTTPNRGRSVVMIR